VIGNVVVVGAGLAGAKAAEALRDLGFAGRVTLVGDERQLPYERPPLSKGYLAGSTERESLSVHPFDWYADHDVELRLGTPVTRISRAEHRVLLDDGTHLDYDKLLIGTGSSPRRLPVAGVDAEGVHMLRSVDDSDRLKQLFATITRLVVVGAGWIGLEVAAAARTAGVEVTVVEALDLPLVRVLGPEVAGVFAELHREHGVDFRFGAVLQEITVSDGRATGVALADGTRIEADAVLVAVGVAPNTGLAEACALNVANGIVVDEGLRTSDPDIYAAGDVANAYHPLLERQIRVEHWANARNQPAVAARSMLGEPASYDAMPYFYTDQYDLGMEYIGYVAPGDYDEVVFRGDVAGREFVAFWLAGGRVMAGMHVNVWDTVEALKTLVREGKPVELARLRDPEIPLDAV
jgi:3-phenylpropionate/trans-cinnamate dioxygenase ferredoxin reductase component